MAGKLSGSARRGRECGPGDTQTLVYPEYELAVAAANRWNDEVSESRESAWNPLFLCGPAGCGKSHLVNQIAQQLAESNGRVCCLDTRSQLRDLSLIPAAANVDFFVLEDLHLFKGTAKIQQRLCHIVDEFLANRVRIVVTSREPPGQPRSLMRTIKSRLSSGLVIQIPPLTPGTRIRAFHHFSRRFMDRLESPALGWIRPRLPGTIGGIKKFTMVLQRLVESSRRPISVPILEASEQPLFSDRANPLKRIVIQVCKQYGVRAGELMRNRQGKRFRQPRQVGMYLARRLTALPVAEISRHFKAGCPTAVSYACRKIRERKAKDNEFARMLEQLQTALACS